MRTKYKNLPVREDVYDQVAVVAEANGHGLGAQVEQWVKRELPQCEHPKTAVVIDIFPSQVYLPGTNLQRNGWYCPTCNRVYQRIENLDRLETAQPALVTEQKRKGRKH
jgi:hypothetical protein